MIKLFCITTFLRHVSAIYFAYKLMDCSYVEQQWILPIFIFLHVISLFFDLFIVAIMSTNGKELSKSSQPQTKSAVMMKELSFTQTFLWSLLLFSTICLYFFIVFIDIYFLIHLYQCNTSYLIIYLTVVLANIVTSIPFYCH